MSIQQRFLRRLNCCSRAKVIFIDLYRFIKAKNLDKHIRDQSDTKTAGEIELSRSQKPGVERNDDTIKVVPETKTATELDTGKKKVSSGSLF
jgi:hypothetical protein